MEKVTASNVANCRTLSWQLVNNARHNKFQPLVYTHQCHAGNGVAFLIPPERTTSGAIPTVLEEFYAH